MTSPKGWTSLLGIATRDPAALARTRGDIAAEDDKGGWDGRVLDFLHFAAPFPGEGVYFNRMKPCAEAA